MELYVGLHGDEEPEILTRVIERDLVAELSMARADGQSLFGAEPSLVVGEVPDEWVVAYGDRSLAHWERLTGDAKHAELMVLDDLPDLAVHGSRASTPRRARPGAGRSRATRRSPPSRTRYGSVPANWTQSSSRPTSQP